MKKSSYKYYLIILGLAIVLSAAIIRTTSIDNVPFCVQVAGCTPNNEPKGQVTERQFGYPLTYKKVSVFRPTHGDEKKPDYAGYAEATSEQQKLSLLNLIINTVFWFALLKSVADLLPLTRKTPSTDAAQPPENSKV